MVDDFDIKKMLDETMQKLYHSSKDEAAGNLESYFDLLSSTPHLLDSKKRFPFVWRGETNCYRLTIDGHILDFPEDFYFFTEDLPVKINNQNDPELIFALLIESLKIKEGEELQVVRFGEYFWLEVLET